MKLKSTFSALVVLLFGATSGWAQFAWIGNGIDGTITDAGNWSPSVPGFASGTDNVTFGDAAQTAVMLGSNSVSLGNLTFSGSTAAY